MNLEEMIDEFLKDKKDYYRAVELQEIFKVDNILLIKHILERSVNVKYERTIRKKGSGRRVGYRLMNITTTTGGIPPITETASIKGDDDKDWKQVN